MFCRPFTLTICIYKSLYNGLSYSIMHLTLYHYKPQYLRTKLYSCKHVSLVILINVIRHSCSCYIEFHFSVTSLNSPRIYFHKLESSPSSMLYRYMFCQHFRFICSVYYTTYRRQLDIPSQTFKAILPSTILSGNMLDA